MISDMDDKLSKTVESLEEEAEIREKELQEAKEKIKLHKRIQKAVLEKKALDEEEKKLKGKGNTKKFLTLFRYKFYKLY